MQNKYEALFTTWKIGKLEIKNRICMMPMAGTSLVDVTTGRPAKVYDYYKERAENDVGLFITAGPIVAPFLGNKWLHEKKNPFLASKDTIDMIHRNGAKIIHQISAGAGGRNFPAVPAMYPLIDKGIVRTVTKPFLHIYDYQRLNADPDMPGYWDYAEPHEAPQVTEELIAQFVRSMGLSAKYLKEAGIDGIELHAMHFGYLMDQFALPYLNHRKDRYGEASWEDRCRFACEIIREIKKECGDDFPVSVRLGMRSFTKGLNQGALPGEEYTEVGRTLEDTIICAKLLEEAGADVFNVDNGTYDSYYWAHPPVYMPLNCNLADAEEFRKHVTKPVIVTGRMQPDAAAEAVARGGIDGMGVARQLLCDEAYARKIKEGRIEDIRPCIGCHACVPNTETGGHGVLLRLSEYGKCAQNPRVFEESKYAVKQAKKPLKIAVIGAGIGGVECAMQFAKRGHTVDLYEKSDRIGGTFIAAAAPDFKEKDKDMIAWYDRALKASTVRTHFNTEIKSLDELKADEIIIATGAVPRQITFPGSGKKTLTAVDYLLRKEEVGDKVAVVGGGVTGCEVAYELALMGKHPFVVEMQDRLMTDKTACAANTEMLRDEFKLHKVPVYLSSKMAEVYEDYVVIETPEGRKEIPCDSVITSIGFASGSPLADKENKKEKHIHFIGDVNKVGNIKSAVYAANDLVLKISK